jgi:hypothetical protein
MAVPARRKGKVLFSQQSRNSGDIRWTKTTWKDPLLPDLLACVSVMLSGGNDCGAVFGRWLDPPTPDCFVSFVFAT